MRRVAPLLLLAGLWLLATGPAAAAHGALRASEPAGGALLPRPPRGGAGRAPPPSPLAVAGRWAYYWGLTLLLGAAATGLLVFDRRLPGRPGPLLGLAVLAAAAGLLAMVV